MSPRRFHSHPNRRALRVASWNEPAFATVSVIGRLVWRKHDSDDDDIEGVVGDGLGLGLGFGLVGGRLLLGLGVLAHDELPRTVGGSASPRSSSSWQQAALRVPPRHGHGVPGVPEGRVGNRVEVLDCRAMPGRRGAT